MLKLVNFVIWIVALLIVVLLFLRMMAEVAPYYQYDGEDEKGHTMYVKVVSNWFKKFLFLLILLLLFALFFAVTYFMLEIDLKISIILSILSIILLYIGGGILYAW